VTNVTVVAAASADLETVESLLQRQRLPLEGLREPHQHMFVARAGNRLVGCASLELYEDAALLRSVAVDAAYRGSGVGAALTRAALRLAERAEVSSVYLLTTTADRYFSRFGFEAVDRADVPSTVLTSAEFTGACPSSAMVMRKLLTSPT
jgi:amino-acid N-acetyltransferase